jgi:hypothetical protein
MTQPHDRIYTSSRHMTTVSHAPKLSMALRRSRLAKQDSPSCESCEASEAGNRYFVPWSAASATGRGLCYACLLPANVANRYPA